MMRFGRKTSHSQARELYALLVLRHESTSDARERESICDRLREERRNTMLAAVICHDHDDQNGADFHYAQFREASGALYTITEEEKYISGMAGDIRNHARPGVQRKPQT